MQIKYGRFNKIIDVTNICLSKLTKNNIITIPAGDFNRTPIFSDPIYGTKKHIFILIDDVLTEYEDVFTLKINIGDKKITAVISNTDLEIKLSNLHSKLKIKYGTFLDELPEQKMSIKYLTGNEKVLEIGGNIGRNSLVIASILGKNKNFVVLESNKEIANKLLENRHLNKLRFHIEPSALSTKKLIQRGWCTMASDTLIDGYNWVDIITLKDLNTKYNVEFDTLILDCEGAFYYILMDMPEILNNIKLIIMENDYHDISHKNYVDKILKEHHFYVDHTEGGGWGPCKYNFYETWKKSAF